MKITDQCIYHSINAVTILFSANQMAHHENMSI